MLLFPGTSQAEVADQGPAGWPEHVRSILLPVAVAVLVAISLFATFMEGKRLGMDHIAAVGPQSEQRSITVALSDIVYKLNLGYVGYTSVFRKLESVWNEGARSDSDTQVLISNSRSRTILNAAIQAATELGPQPPGYLSDHTLFTMYYDDVGYVDYVKYAFRLFGFRIEAMYYLFFTILAVSAFAFLITFRDDPAALAVLLANVFVFLIEVHVGNFSADVPTFAGMRHGSTLGLLPMWHFVFLTMRPSRLSVLNVGLGLVQLLILILAIKIRGSASWMALFIVAVAVASALWRWLQKSTPPRSGIKLVRGIAQWPTLLLLVGLFANGQYMKAALHPVYFTDEATSYHILWHSIYTGWIWFDRSPDPKSASSELTSPYVRSMIEKGAQNDGVGYYAALEYLRNHHWMYSDPTTLEVPAPLGFRTSLTDGNNPRWGLYNEIMRHVVMDLVLQHPFAVLRIVLITGPTDVVKSVIMVLGKAPSVSWMLLVALSGLTMAALQEVTNQTPPPTQVRDTIGLTTAATVLAAVINIIAYAAPHTISDLLLSLLIFFQVAVWALAALAITFARRAARSEPS